MRSGAKPGPAPRPAIERAKEAAARGQQGGLVYFWSANDAARPEARSLQNDIFFRPEVRRLGQRLVAVKLERERSPKAFAEFGLKDTPAVVVLDASFAPVKVFQGAVEERALVEAMRKATPAEDKQR